MKDIQSRPLQGLNDVMRVHRFLAETYQRTQTGHNWEIRRWEGRFWHYDGEDEFAARMAQPQTQYQLWETAAGDLVGAAHTEDGGDVHLEVHPEHRALEDDMLAWAEDTLAATNDDGQREITAFALDVDTHRQSVLAARGYTRTEWNGVQRWRDMSVPISDAPIAEGYTIRAIRAGNLDDLERLGQVIAAGFGRDSFPTPILVSFEKSPSYNADLIIVAEAPDGSFASHSGVTFDRVNRLGIFEPVCTHPDHRRKGLARAAMVEGLRRLAALGAVRACVGTGATNNANGLYAQIGFTHVETVQIWRKVWAAS